MEENTPRAWKPYVVEDRTIWTVGHSNLTLEEFIDLLTVNKIEAIADVRRFPGSRKYPHFNRDALTNALSNVGIDYVHFSELGGRRHPRPNSTNTVWENESFRGYADYMETNEFHTGIERLLALAARKRTAILCAEAVWWRCHRALISDYLKASGVQVQHIMNRTKTEPHPYTTAARLRDGKLSYSPDDPKLHD
ncbi:MAG: DUF488 family protein [Candidatus Omnitrophota bacterium]